METHAKHGPELKHMVSHRVKYPQQMQCRVILIDSPSLLLLLESEFGLAKESTVKREEILYFDTPGKQNTDETIKAAHKRAKDLGLIDIVVASTSGDTGFKACEVFRDFNVVVVTHHAGFEKPGESQLLKPNEDKIRSMGGKIFTGIHGLSGVERAIRFKWNTIEPQEIIADALRIFGNGTKVCTEIVIMAADAGLIQIDKDVVAIAGSGSGADTALVISPVHANNFFAMKVKEIICKPLVRE